MKRLSVIGAALSAEPCCVRFLSLSMYRSRRVCRWRWTPRMHASGARRLREASQALRVEHRRAVRRCAVGVTC